MSPEEIKEKAKWVSEWFEAVAEGKTGEVRTENGWEEWNKIGGPCISSRITDWRIKLEPRKRWVIESSGLSSCDPRFRSYWENAGETVTEWQEVKP